MIEYIYFVKCPSCEHWEDEHFSFFNDAKDFALSCLSNKPIITQIEVCRNDFGECTDSKDLGTIWSWEDIENITDDEPAVSVFTRDDLEDLGEEDPEFAALDNSLDFEPEPAAEPAQAPAEPTALDAKPDNFRKPIPADMTIEQLVEAMEENEDTVECVCCQELHPKEDCKHDEKHGWICPDCADEVVECTWCEELYDRSQCRYEVDLGWLCDRCEAAIKSRGETLTFREGSYWDFLDEDTKLEEASLSDIAAAYAEETGTTYSDRDLLDYTGINEFEDDDDRLVARRDLYRDYNLIRRRKTKDRPAKDDRQIFVDPVEKDKI